MVAVPRSKGCLVCRKRSVKCDEIRPSCSQCRRGGRQCSGYDLPMTFIIQQPHLKAPKNTTKTRKKKPRKQHFKSNEVIPDTGEVILAFPVHRQHTIYQSFLNRSIHSPDLNRTQLVDSFVNTLFPPNYLTPKLSFFADWLWLIPQYMSRNPLLTSAAQCLALGFFGSETKNTALKHSSREWYSKALWCLSRAVEDVRLGLSTETLCSTMLLGFYEIYMQTQEVSWITHAGGAGRLMQIRGASRHREGFDYIMFLGIRGIIISEAVTSCEPCFLDSQDWKNIVGGGENYQTSSDIFRFHNEFSNLFASVPGIAVRLTAVTNCRPADPSRTSIIEDALSLRNDFTNWHLRFTLAHPANELPLDDSTTNTANITTIHPPNHSQVWISAWLCAYYACQIMLNTRLTLLTNMNTSTENAELISKLRIAVGTCSRAGNSGGQCLAFALPVALTLCKEELNAWILEALGEVSEEGRGGVSEGQIAMLRSFVEVKL